MEKFRQEVYWRRYWKSWLSLRPQLWDEYRSELAQLLASSREHLDNFDFAAAEPLIAKAEAALLA